MRFSKSQINALRKAYADKATAPISVLPKFRALFSKMPNKAILQLVTARIKFVSPLALNEAIRRGIVPSALRNPPSKTQRKAMKLAGKMAYRIWHHVRHQGYAIPVPARTPKLVKTYVQKILKANGIDWSLK
jgi:hypothetical protein